MLSRRVGSISSSLGMICAIPALISGATWGSDFCVVQVGEVRGVVDRLRAVVLLLARDARERRREREPEQAN